MLDKVKTQSIERATVASFQNVDGFSQVKWELIHWCGMAVKLVTKHDIISEVIEPDCNYHELEYQDNGEVISVDICLDNNELHNAFNGLYDHTLNDYIERLTDCCVTNDTEFSS